MKKEAIITALLAFVTMAGQAQEERIDTVIPKFLSNGYFFREMPTLPDGEKTMSRLKDKEGNSVIVINVNATLPKSLIRKAIPREQVHKEVTDRKMRKIAEAKQSPMNSNDAANYMKRNLEMANHM